MLYMIALLVCLVSYALGSISNSILIAKRISGKDIRQEGSGNAGATNMLRVHGKKPAILTLVLDALKGVLAVLLAMLVDWIVVKNTDMFTCSVQEQFLFGGNLKYYAGFFAVVGHDYPVFFRFRGGKGVATSLGVVLATNWQVGLIVAVIAILIMVISRYVSLGSICAGILYPCGLAAYLVGSDSWNGVAVVSAALLGILLIYKHRTNIIRLRAGTESKLFQKKNKGEKQS